MSCARSPSAACTRALSSATPSKAAGVLGDDVELAVGDFADRGSIGAPLHGVDRVFLACGNVPGAGRVRVRGDRRGGGGWGRRVVKLSGPARRVDSPLMFERWHGEIERHLRGSGVPSVVLRPGPT